MIFLFALPVTSWVVILLCAFLTVAISFYSTDLEKKELTKTIETQGDAAKDLIAEMNIRYNNALLVQEIGQATSRILDIDEIVDTVVSAMEKRLDFDRGILLLANKEKTRLNVLVMFTPLFHGVGPHHFNKKYTWEYKGILVGTDPVAVDVTGLRILLAKRKEYFNEEKALAVPAKHIQVADTDYGLGVSDPAKIEVVKVGWKEGSLI